MSKVKENVCSFENLYEAMNKCKNSVMWKTSVSGFVKNGLINCNKLHNQLMDGTYKIDKYSYFTITEPKKRDIVSTRMKDRVFQRSFCDNYLYEVMTKGLIYDNAACQIGGGTDFTRNRLTAHLQRFFRKHGKDGYVLQCDISGYFGNTKHSVAKRIAKERVDDDWALSHIYKIIDSYGTEENPEMGLGLGSQVTQLIQLCILDEMDHFIKDVLRVKAYVRYMDDFLIIHEDKEYLKYCLEEINKQLQKVSLNLNNKKTQIFPLSHGIDFLGFKFLLTDSGKVIKKLLKEKISQKKRKLRKMKKLVDQGLITKEDVNKSYESWKSSVRKGNTYSLIISMDQFYKNLWEE